MRAGLLKRRIFRAPLGVARSLAHTHTRTHTHTHTHTHTQRRTLTRDGKKTYAKKRYSIYLISHTHTYTRMELCVLRCFGAKDDDEGRCARAICISRSKYLYTILSSRTAPHGESIWRKDTHARTHRRSAITDLMCAASASLSSRFIYRYIYA